MIKAIAFDAYGTIFDVHSVGLLADTFWPGRGAELAALWRTKQIDYTRLRTLSDRYEPFSRVTRRRVDQRHPQPRARSRRSARRGVDDAIRPARRIPRCRTRAAPAEGARPAARHPVQRRSGDARRGGRQRQAPRRLRSSAVGASRRQIQDRARGLRVGPAGIWLRSRRDPLRFEQRLGRVRRDLVRVYDVGSGSIAPASRSRNSASSPPRPAARWTKSSRSRPTIITKAFASPSWSCYDHTSPGHDDRRGDHARVRRDPDVGSPRLRRQAVARLRVAPSRTVGRTRRTREEARRRRTARLPARDEVHPRRRLEDFADSRSAVLPTRRDHRAGRGEDGHQRVQLGSRQLHDGLRGQQRAVVDQPDPGADQSQGRDPPHADADTGVAGRHQDLPAQRQDRHAAGPAARLASRREARADRRQAHLRRHLRLRAVRVPQREGAGRAWRGALLLPAQDGVASRGAAVERHLHDGRAGGRARARHDQGHGADRDHPRRVRDGRDPLRAARALGRSQRGPLGLHLLVHQEVQGRPQLLSGRSRQGHDDRAVHAGLCIAVAEDLPQARPRRPSAA